MFDAWRRDFDVVRQICTRFWTAAQRTLERLQGDVDRLLTQRAELAQGIERDQAQAEKAAETINSLEAKVRTSRAAADKTIAVHQAETSKAETSRAAAEAAATEASAARDRIENARQAEEKLLEEKRAQVADDRAAGGWFTERGRQLKAEFENEKGLRTQAEADRDEARNAQAAAAAQVAEGDKARARLAEKLRRETFRREAAEGDVRLRERRARAAGRTEGWREASETFGSMHHWLFGVLGATGREDIAELLAASGDGDRERVQAAVAAVEGGLPPPRSSASPERAPERPGPRFGG